jgi:hypothetical protein
VDIGRAIEEITIGNNDKIIAAALSVLRCVPQPVFAVCGALSLSPDFGLPMSILLALVLVMPALTQLSLVIGEWRSDVPGAEIVGLIPAVDVAEWRGRGWWPADTMGEEVTVDHLLRAISSLTCLIDLTIRMNGKMPNPVTFPRSLRRLKVTTVSAMFLHWLVLGHTIRSESSM